MTTGREVRRSARRWHDELAAGSDDLVPASTLIERAVAGTGLRILVRTPGDTLLAGANAGYDAARGLVLVSSTLPAAEAAFHIAHEFAHHWLGSAARCDGAVVDASDEAGDALVGETVAYAPKQRTEADANLHAREWLLPLKKLRLHVARVGCDAEALAASLGVPMEIVALQLADALFLPAEREEPAASPVTRVPAPPDAGQARAIDAAVGACFVRAAPGAGKTTALVGRVVRLLSAGEDPRRIFTLSYSNASAAELAARIVAAAGPSAAGVWASTLHAFALELLRKHGGAIGIREDVRLLDAPASLALLEERLADLGLDHYLDLHEPLRPLKAILGAISRAKDELVSPAEYERLARAMLCEAREPHDVRVAERALEVARAYAVYDQALRARRCVDFGDLIARAVEVLRAAPEVQRAIRKDIGHLLVDEYQDMNRASAVLVLELTRGGPGPWAVGDLLQIIYRFRGASPANLVDFPREHPGAEIVELATNYRSAAPIVRLFEAFGKTTTAARFAVNGPLEAARGESGGVVTLDVAPTFEAEVGGLAAKVRARAASQALRKAPLAKGGAYRDHAVLARSHTTLEKLAKLLEADGIPCLYFGDFFERAEIRDLLALLSVVAEHEGVGVSRVARLPEYATPEEDVATLVAWRRHARVSMAEALERVGDIEGLTAEGRDALDRLARDVRRATPGMSAHRFLTGFLFGGGGHLRRLLADESVGGQQRRLAIHQLLRFAAAFRPPAGTSPIRALLAHVRRLEMLDEERQLRQLPPEAADIDAVRLMTIHASKGLEFPVVHLPALSAHLCPCAARAVECPPPRGMVDDGELTSREAEEESLLYVALSRARDELHLSHALKYGDVRRQPSPFLERLKAVLPRASEGAATELVACDESPEVGPKPASEGLPRAWSAHALETYMECPRRFHYGDVLRVGGDPASPYRRLHAALRRSIGWLRESPSHRARSDEMRARFDEDWASVASTHHPHEPVYREAAWRMLETAALHVEGEILPVEHTARLPSSGVAVSCRADHVARTEDGIIVRRWKTNRLAQRETRRASHVLVQHAVEQAFPGERVRFEHVSLRTGARRDGTLKPAQLRRELVKVEEAVDGAQAGRFDAAPDAHKCPRCPFYFVCSG